MLTHPTIDRLRELGLAGMARALEEQRRHADAADLGYEDRLAMLGEREALERDTKRLATRLLGCGSLACANRLPRRTSTIAPPAVSTVLEALSNARGDGRYARRLKSLARVHLLILGDCAITPLAAEQRRDLMEVIDDRPDRVSTIVTSQVPVTLVSAFLILGCSS